MIYSDTKSLGEQIVEMLCDGMDDNQIKEALGIETNDRLAYLLHRMQSRAALPIRKDIYKDRKADILGNVEKWKSRCDKINKIEEEYMASLARFDKG